MTQLAERQRAFDLLSSDEIPSSVKLDYQNAATKRETRLHNASVISQRPLFLPRTLDQFDHPTSTPSLDRLRNQVVPRQTEDSETGAKALVVKQLWLVIPDDRKSATSTTRLQLVTMRQIRL